jgi:hypothetical protein
MSNSTVQAEQVHAICTAFVNGADIAYLATLHAMKASTIEKIIRANMQKLCVMVENQGTIIANSLTEQGKAEQNTAN